MKIIDLIHELQSAAEELGYDAEVRTYSERYCCDLHKIEGVETSHNGKAYINITRG